MNQFVLGSAVFSSKFDWPNSSGGEHRVKKYFPQPAWRVAINTSCELTKRLCSYNNLSKGNYPGE